MQWDEEIEFAVRDSDYRVRAQAYRALAQFRFRQKLQLLRRGLEDESPAARGSALISLEAFSRDHPGDVNWFRPLLHELAARDPNVAVRRLAVICLKNGTRAPRHAPAARGDGRVGRGGRGAPQDRPRRPRRAPEEGGEMTPSVAVVMGSQSDWRRWPSA